MLKTIQNIIVLLSILSFFSVYGCAVNVNGNDAAAVAGTYSYVTGDLTKTYESEYYDTVRASRSTLETLKIPITNTISDGLKTEFMAKRPDETPVTIEIVRIDRCVHMGHTVARQKFQFFFRRPNALHSYVHAPSFPW